MFSSVLSLKPDKKFIFWGKIAVFAGLLTYIAYVLRQQPFDWTTVWTQLSRVDHGERWLAGLLVLMPVNWGFEALKWKILLKKVQKTTFWEAYKGVLAGVTLGFALPAQLGDTAGRVLSLRRHQAEAVGASLVSGGMQFYVALVFGTVAWVYYMPLSTNRNNSAGQWLLVILSLLSVGGVAFGIGRWALVSWLAKRSALDRFVKYWNVIGLYSNSEIIRALGVAALRYIVFSGQFYLALRLVGIDLPAALVTSGIGLVFLVKTITPAFNLLSDLGVREAVSLWVFSPFGVPTALLLTATLTLWFVNILTPVLVGLIWVWKLKLSR